MNDHSGFTLAEFLIATLILLIVTSAAFGVITDLSRTAGYQAEVQSVINNTRLALHTAGRYIRQAGNDPFRTGIIGVSAINENELRIVTDVTGSAGASNPDRGDPDGDSNDSGEDVAIRYNRTTQSLEIVPQGSPAQVIAGNISDLSFILYDAAGNPAAVGGDVRRIRVTLSGSASTPDPQTNQVFSIQLCSDFELST